MSNVITVLKITGLVVGVAVAKQFTAEAAGELVKECDSKLRGAFGWSFYSKPLPDDKS